jgi:hypothetical protein
MKRNLIGTLSLVVLYLLFSSTGYAQAFAKADVPFAFTVAKKTLPSGRYLVTTNDRGVVTIQSEDTGASIISLARKELPKVTNPKMVFHYVGNQYFLSEIWGAAGTSGLTLSTTKLEKELQMANSKTVGQVVVALK